jgi:hypothetical protein
MQIHAQLLIRVNTCRFMTESPEALRHAHSCSALDTGSHMMIQTNTCRYMPSAWHMQKHVYTRSALDTGQHIKILGQLPINAERCQTLNTHNTCRHTLSSRYVQMYAALNVCRYMLRHARLSKSQTHADTRSALDTCRHMHTRAPLLMQANK